MLPPPDAEGDAALVALLTALPFGLAAGWMLLLAKSSQRFGEGHEPWHCSSHTQILKLLWQRKDAMLHVAAIWQPFWHLWYVGQ